LALDEELSCASVPDAKDDFNEYRRLGASAGKLSIRDRGATAMPLPSLPDTLIQKDKNFANQKWDAAPKTGSFIAARPQQHDWQGQAFQETMI
jgi:hypothetical protein